jgi:predicted nucleic acid-binding protein
VDTSAFIALAREDDPNHQRAAAIWQSLGRRREDVFTTNYVIVETVALVHHRYGVSAVRDFVRGIALAVDIEWVAESEHLQAIQLLLGGGRRGPSIVDLVSFLVMQRKRIKEAFAFDQHFTDQGFALPAS